MPSSPSRRPSIAAERRRRPHLVVALALLALLAASAARAAEFAPDPTDEAGARRESKVSWYTSTPVDAAQAIANRFQQATGIRVELFRSGGSAVMRRFLQERQAGRNAADVLTTSDPAATASLARQGTFVAFRPRFFDRVPDAAKDPAGYYIAQRLNMLGIFVRSDLVAEPERPRTWSDLTDPKYKGKLVMSDPSFTALQLVAVATLSRTLGWGFYEKLKANDILIVQGHEQVEDALKRGERPIAAEGLDSYAVEDRAQGHPVLTVYPSEGAFAVPSPTAIVKGSPDPAAAKLFAAFMIGDEVQKLFPAEGIYAARIDVEPPAGSPKLGELKLLAVDYAAIEKSSAEIKERFNEIFQ